MPQTSQIEVRVSLDAAVAESIAVVVAGQQTLEDVVRWSLGQRPVRAIERVVVQDEYTHDVVLRWGEGVYLVYDTT
jgi:hypothetical protein